MLKALADITAKNLRFFWTVPHIGNMIQKRRSLFSSASRFCWHLITSRGWRTGTRLVSSPFLPLPPLRHLLPLPLLLRLLHPHWPQHQPQQPVQLADHTTEIEIVISAHKYKILKSNITKNSRIPSRIPCVSLNGFISYLFTVG